LLCRSRAKWIRAGLNVCRSLIIEIKHTAVVLIILLLSGGSQNSTSDVARSTAPIEEIKGILFGCITIVICARIHVDSSQKIHKVTTSCWVIIFLRLILSLLLSFAKVEIEVFVLWLCSSFLRSYHLCTRAAKIKVVQIVSTDCRIGSFLLLMSSELFKTSAKIEAILIILCWI
jgi:hypothetical protein